MSIAIDRTMNRIENSLTSYAYIPILPGAIKIVIGSVQSTAAAVVGLVNLPAAACGRAQLNRYAWTHVLHGLGNIGAGIVEAIPVLGCAIVCTRNIGSIAASDYRITYKDETDGKCLPYESLRGDSIKFSGCIPEDVSEAQEQFNRRSVNLTPDQRIALANQLCSSGF